MKRKNKTKKNALTVAALLLFCLFAAGSLVFVFHNGRKNERNIIKYLEDATSQRQAALAQQIEGNLQLLRGIGIGLANSDYTSPDILAGLFEQIVKNSNFVRIGIAGTDGRIRPVGGRGEVYPEVDISHTDFFKKAIGGREAISETHESLILGDEADLNYYAVPIYEDGRVGGVLCAANRGRGLQRILGVPVFKGEGYFALMDRKGNLVVPITAPGSPAKQAKNIEELLWFPDEKQGRIFQQALRRGGSGSCIGMLESTESILTLYPLGYNGWLVVSAAPRLAINAYYNYTMLGTVGIILAASLLFLLLLFWQIRVLKRSQAELEFLAFTDVLTGIPNYERFQIDAQHLLKQNPGKKFAFWSYDIKQFTNINNLFGSDVGDEVLNWVADVFAGDLPPCSAYCRISSDIFAGVLPYNEKEQLVDWFWRVRAKLASREIIAADKMRIDDVMGFYCVEDFDEELSVDEMLGRSSVARRTAKLAVGSGVQLFTQDMYNRMRRKNALAASGEAAVRQGEVGFFLQPKVHIQGNVSRVIGAEALARWRHKEHGWISPAEFIPLFEENGFVVELDRYIFRQVCAWYVAYRENGGAPIKMAVNVSRQGLMRNDFLAFYSGVKEKYGIPDGVLELEFTESVLLVDNAMFQNVVSQARRQGFVCSIDDFGSGYSSLNVLKNLPIDMLKLDAVFFRDSIDIRREEIVVANFIRMAGQLDIRTVAEGVETSRQVDFLRNTGCDIVQGYYFSEPKPPEEFEKMMRETQGFFPEGAARPPA